MFRKRYTFTSLMQLAIFASLLIFAGRTNAQSTNFNYQAQLQDGGVNLSGNYDLQFTLRDSLTAGTQQPQPVGSRVTLVTS